MRKVLTQHVAVPELDFSVCRSLITSELIKEESLDRLLCVVRVTWELIRNAVLGPPPETYWIRISAGGALYGILIWTPVQPLSQNWGWPLHVLDDNQSARPCGFSSWISSPHSTHANLIYFYFQRHTVLSVFCAYSASQSHRALLTSPVFVS